MSAIIRRRGLIGAEKEILKLYWDGQQFPSVTGNFIVTSSVNDPQEYNVLDCNERELQPLTRTLGASYMRLGMLNSVSTAAAIASIHTVNQIDFTGYSKICIEFSGYSSSNVGSLALSTYSVYPEKFLYWRNTKIFRTVKSFGSGGGTVGKTTSKFDVSSANNGYLSLVMTQYKEPYLTNISTYFDVYRIWLEK